MFASPKRSALLSGMLHGGAILLILAVTGVKPQLIPRLHDILVIPPDMDSYKQTARSTGGGGGGGVQADSPASIGKPAPFARLQFVLPTVEIPNTTPILPMEPTLIGDPNLKLPTFNYSQYGDPNGVLGKPSGGPGKGGGIGDGDGTGIGSGHGSGLGPGDGEGMGGVGYIGTGGGSVTAPLLLSKIEPEYSEDARKARVQGTVLLRIEVNTRGQAQNITVRQGLGMGLDDRAIDAVQKWKFSPGKVNGKPAVVVAYVEVNFRLL
jgi:protein TonB